MNTGGGGGGAGSGNTTTYAGGLGGSGIVVVSYSLAPIITTTGTLSDFSGNPGIASSPQTYTVSGSNLTADINITAPADFELSTDGSAYSSGLTLPQSGGTLTEQTLYVRFNRATAGTSSGNITHDSAGATQKTVAVSGTAGDPTITVTSSMTAFSQFVGSPSAEQTYTIAGTFLKGDVTVTAPTDFQISKTTGSGWASPLSFSPTNGTLAATTVYVRMNRSTEGSSTGDISHTSMDATTQDLAVSGSAALPPPWTAYNDASWVSGQPETNITKYGITSSTNTGTLMDFATGQNTGVTATFSWNGTLTTQTGSGTAATSGDAFAIFDGKVSTAGIIGCATQYSCTDMDNWIDVSLTGLDPAKTYTFATTTIRNGSSYTTRDTQFTISDIDAATNASSSGVTVIDNQNVWFTTGTNLSEGYVAKWTGIQPGSDGDFTVRAAKHNASEFQFYGQSVFMLQEEAGSSNPTITTTGTLSAFYTAPGVPSVAQSYTVAGRHLTDSIYITAPGGYQLSTDNSNFSPSLELEQTGGTLAATTIYVRLYSATEGTFSGNISHTSAGASEKDVAVSGSVLYVYTLAAGNDGHGTVTLSPSGGSYSSGTTVTLSPVPDSGYIFSSWGGANNGDIVNTSGVYTIVMNENKSVSANFVAGTCTTVNLTAVEDTYLSANDVQYNNGGNTQLHVDATTGTSRRTSLLKWDLSGIPSNQTVSSASLSLYVEDASPLVFDLYALRRSWVEGTGNRTTSSDSANWNTYDGVNGWGTEGAAGTTADRFDTNLWSAGTTSFSTTGSKTETLNSAGMAVVQSWINGSLGNHGLIMQNYSGSTNDAVYFTSREGTTAANRPILNVTYCIASTGPTITTTSSLSAFASNIGVPSAEQSYSVTGANLTGDIAVTPPADFEISLTSGSGWVSNPGSINLTPVSGTVASTTIYVRFLRSTAGTSSGNLTHVSSPATQVNVPVSGTATNDAPAVTLVQPSDDATGVSTTPNLQVTVTDPDADTSSVSFYGRAAGAGTGADFMLALIPDPQNESQYNVDLFKAQTNWIVNNKTANNIVYVTATGDMVNSSSDANQYANADSAVDILDTGGVPYTMATGNHDIAMGTTLYANYFGTSRYASHLYSDGYWFGGSYDDYNTYSLFSAAGMDFILINLQYSPTTAVISWADNLLTTYASRRAIVEQHDILNTDNSWNNQTSYNSLRSHANLFLMLCGHMHAGSDGAAYVAGTGTDGHTIHVVQADYQDFSNGNGWLRLFRFSPANDMIYMTTYSPYTGGSITTDPDQKNLAYEMASSGPYTLIGTVNGVTSGSNASISWPLSENTAYEWYAVANDGTTSTTSSTWSFTTGSSVSAKKIRDDYDGDGKTDAVKFDSGTGAAWWLKSSTGLWDGQWLGSDSFAYVGASDFDGDGKTDPAKFYSAAGTVWWVKSSTGTLDGQWLGPDLFTYITGSDFDGDGKADPAKFYPATGTVWWVKSTTHTLDGQWLGGDAFTYVSGSDFDGDGKTDPAKFYPATGTVWWVKSSTHTIDGMWLGPDSFTYVPASDFDGDGKTDPAKFYPDSGNLWWVKSSTGTMDGAWLGPGSLTYVPGCDFNGDGKTDPARYDASTHTLSWLNVGTGTWTDIGLGTGTYTLANGQ